MAKVRGSQSEFEQFMGDCLANADPIVDAFMKRHEALLQRATMLEQALEEILRLEANALSPVSEVARRALDG